MKVNSKNILRKLYTELKKLDDGYWDVELNGIIDGLKMAIEIVKEEEINETKNIHKQR